CIVFGLITTAAAAPVTYTGFTITDGQIGNWTFHNARVVLRFDGDTNDVQLVQFPDPLDPTTTAQVAITGTGTDSVPTHQSIGFGSYAGGRGYPFSLTQNHDNPGLVENSALEALGDPAANGDTGNYTPGVPGLATDLTNPTVLSAGASS